MELLKKYELDKVLIVLSLLLGMFITNDIIYFININNTYFNFSYLISAMILFYILVTSKFNVNLSFKKYNIFYLLFIIQVALSSISVFFHFTDPSEQLIYFKNVIALVMNIIIIIDIFMLEKYKKYLLIGLFVGICINFIYTIICYIGYQFNISITLSEIFNQPSFYIPKSIFRSQGLFLEPSHFMACLLSTFFISIMAIQKNFNKLIYIFIAFFCVIISMSGNVILFLALFALYLFCLLLNRKGKSSKYSLPTIIFSLVAFAIIIIFIIENWDQIFEKIIKSLNGSNLEAEENAERFTNMKRGLMAFWGNPFGYGYGMSMTILQRLEPFHNNNNAFNYFITLLVEVGAAGCFLYIGLLVSLFARLFFGKRTMYQRMLALSILGIAMMQFGNGRDISHYVSFVFGLAMLESYNIKVGRIA